MPIIPITGSSGMSPIEEPFSQKQVLSQASTLAKRLIQTCDVLKKNIANVNNKNLQLERFQMEYQNQKISKKEFLKQTKFLEEKNSQFQQSLTQDFQAFQSDYNDMKNLFNQYKIDFSNDAQFYFSQFIEHADGFIDKFSPFGGIPILAAVDKMHEFIQHFHANI